MDMVMTNNSNTINTSANTNNINNFNTFDDKTISFENNDFNINQYVNNALYSLVKNDQ